MQQAAILTKAEYDAIPVNAAVILRQELAKAGLEIMHGFRGGERKPYDRVDDWLCGILYSAHITDKLIQPRQP